MRKSLVLASIVFCFCPYFARGEPARSELIERVESARADTDIFPANCVIPAPDISGWEIVQTSRIEFRISDEAVAYLGLDIEYAEYRNPDDPGEFVRVVSRHIPMIPARPVINNGQLFREVATALYVQKKEQDRLNEIGKKTDSILVVRWRTKKNSRTGKDMKDGNVDIWFLQSSGECLTTQNKRVGVQFMTENVGNGKPHNVFVGIKYQVGDAYHILKVDRRDLVQLMNERRK
ncbi:MAG: hypothetical protein A2655_00995 [Candidatus Yanofskybacteria bacterium RIFCSPHIGHO2_01_FULL_43_42]|uniref:Uncharacterized protein n=1 Tax=Candidatus Yanofskybacteria bacterium RIFCSPLOWO2_01_FULL_43_22 TaxID=1802695 RepID=A0A1F8GH38_9BACT|nr:MAG: hypothetical protein A2655_00995 [Candidatus Yanofskybacteria bacterium RIFCSPHIGHO2_01_FULL_43_42]OGN12387.1 MAG: hypothetical protein A3D48_01725 [Candidatus Yanofskybacteria bacterium RIFCSPHIGHO2_02_FULL_43_17]OGN23759.1 MAG: hypothetical protein A3A13_01785 [Candidatus Yanofskybacteria bacterium RIFCSPLOWO2_01_FULL_43_22]